MAITKKQNQKLQKIFENVNSLLFDISELGNEGEIRHTDIKGELYVVSGKELTSLDVKIDKIYDALKNFCEEMELDNGKA